MPRLETGLRLARLNSGLKQSELAEGGEITAELAGGPQGRRSTSDRALVGSIASRWVAHALSREDPLALTTPADAILVRSRASNGMVRLRALRPLEALQA